MTLAQRTDDVAATLRQIAQAHPEAALAQPIVTDRYAGNHATGSFILIDEATKPTVARG